MKSSLNASATMFAGINAHQLTRRLRDAWAPAHPNNHSLDHEALLGTCSARGLAIWREQIGPVLYFSGFLP